MGIAIRLLASTLVLALASEAVAEIWVSPRPGAACVAPETSIILRSGTRPERIEVTGSSSGHHLGTWTDALDGETFLFRPERAFLHGERVKVRADLGEGETFSFDFTIARELLASPEEVSRLARDDWEVHAPDADTASASRRRGGVVLPGAFPPRIVTISDDPAPGYLVAGPESPVSHPQYALMLDDAGQPAFFRAFANEAFDFKKQKHANVYTYLESFGQTFVVANESFETIDEFGPENGYELLNGHDVQIAPNGNVLIGIRDLQTIDMSQIVPGGDPNATVLGFVMQEQDAAHNVVFQWRSWDHYAITDASGIDFTASWIDYVHFNAFEYDDDGDILISAREMNEITKVDRQTGDIRWRMGGSQNEFTLVGDAQWFTRQHSIRRTSTGTVTIFDNGNFSTPVESRAVEYSLDEVGKVATLVWEFRNDPPVHAAWGSNVQRLPNGNTLIGYAPQGMVTEVRPDGTKAFEMSFLQHWNYRAFRFEWNGVAARPELWHEAVPFEVTIRFAKFGDPDVDHWNVYRDDHPEPTTLVGTTTDDFFVLGTDALELLYVRVTAVDGLGNESPYSNELNIFAVNPVDAPTAGSQPSGLALLPNRPNPFTPSTTLSFVLALRGPIELSVYDVRGRLLRTLDRGVLEAGAYDVVWDGTDRDGRRAGAGVYFYRLKQGSREVTRSMTLLR